MRKVSITKEIEAPQQQVWDFISDIERAPEWVMVMQSLVETTENPVQKGTVYRENSKVGPKESETEWTVTTFDAPQTQIHECEANDFKATLTMHVEPREGGGAVLHHTTEYALLPIFRPLGWLVEKLFVHKSMVQNLNASVEECKRLIENEIVE